MASGQPQGPPKSKRIPMIVDLAFATNVRFLDEHELHLDDVQLYKVNIPGLIIGIKPDVMI